jgi:MOSC domain-containing protein YiiM
MEICVGGPRNIEWQGRTIRTSIFKAPVAGRVRIGRLNVAGDEQSDHRVHGGPDKAVYAYPSEHYAAWRLELPGADLAWGAFGENLTTEGLLEQEVRLGDRYRIGTAELVVTMPRLPCQKLAARFGRRDMIRLFQESGRSGFYLSVAREGEAGAGDAIARLASDPESPTVADSFARHVARTRSS